LIPVAGYLGVIAIVVFSLVPGEWRPSIGLAKPLEHVVAYVIVGAVLAAANRAGWPQILLLIGLAGILEILQVWVPGRDSKLTDFLASSAGALLGGGFSTFVLAWLPRSFQRRMMDKSAALLKPFLPNIDVPILAAGALGVAASMVAAQGAAAWLGAALALIMLAIAVVDGQRFFIPDPLNAAGLGLGVIYCIEVERGEIGAVLVDAALRAAVLALLFFALRLVYSRLRGRQGIGLGDVKLAAVAGIWLNWSVVPVAIEIAAVSALCVYALRCYVLHRPLRPNSRLPFGLFFAPAIWIGWLLQTTVLSGW
jgi:leader peptidase (prepilin peptidase)/N-methyltransferase